MNPLIIILSVIIVIIIFLIIRSYFFSTKTLATNINLKDNPVDISSGEITNPASVLYSFGTWIYVNSFQNNRIITYRDPTNPPSTTNLPRFSLVLGGSEANNESRNKPVLTAVLNANNTPVKVVITTNFPIQKWVYVVVSVDTVFCDCYLDGKLIVSKQIPQILTGQSGSIKFGNFAGLNGDILLTKVSRWDYPLDPQSVWTEYSSGNGLSQAANLSIALNVKTDSNTKEYKIYSN
jgi:hypothetical protein